MWDNEVEISVLLGKTLSKISPDTESGMAGVDRIEFECTDGTRYLMYHEQDCCEGVSVEDCCGDPMDIVGSEILLAECVMQSNENPEGTPAKEYQDSFTWTFYKLATIKGAITIRWYGASNGYYSESVSFIVVEAPNAG